MLITLRSADCIKFTNAKVSMADDPDIYREVDFDFFEDERDKKLKATDKGEVSRNSFRPSSYNDEITNSDCDTDSNLGINYNNDDHDSKLQTSTEFRENVVNENKGRTINKEEDNPDVFSSVSSDSSESMTSESTQSQSDHELTSDSDSKDDSNSDYNPNVDLSISSFSDSGSESKSSKKSDIKKIDLTDDDDDEITDVSPLSSANISPIPAISNQDQGKRAKDVQFHSSVLDNSPKDKIVPGNQSSIDLKLLMQAIAEMEKRQKSSTKKVIFQRASSGRKNPSFSNEEARRIDHENQRLLKEIVNCQKLRRSPLPAATHTIRLTHSAVNRQREHRRIEMENKALLKRIESAKPSKETCRAEQLKDYARLQQNFIADRPKLDLSKKHSPYAGSVSLRSHSASSLFSNSLSTKSDSSLRTKSVKSCKTKQEWDPGW